jgi:CubicO group peptidase (beta-lactamase class C family)
MVESAVIDDGWPLGSPGQYGLDGALLLEMEQRLARSKRPNLHAVIIVRGGVLVYERYFAGEDQRDASEPPALVVFDPTVKHNLNSATKSVISLLIGIALERGWLKDLDTPVLSYFLEYPDLHTPEKERLTLRHLLAMSDGLGWYEFVPPFDSYSRMRQATDPCRYVLEREIVISPGRGYNYNSGTTELLSAILRKAAGKPVDLLAKTELFDPLGIDDVEWRRLANGDPMAAGGLRVRPRDAARIGQLVLDRGLWQGRQIVPASWIAQSTAPQNNGPGVYLYGFQWWLGRSFVRDRQLEWIGAFGSGGQRLIVLPSADMVVFVAAWLQQPQEMVLPESVLLNQYILPAVIRD